MRLLSPLVCPKRFVLLAAFGFMLTIAAAAESGKIRTFAFQEFEADGVPRGWKDDTAWADVDKSFGADRIAEEQQVARLTLEAVRRGKMQILGPVVPLKYGRVYTLRVRLRSQPPMAVEVGIREPRPPFQSWAVRNMVPAQTEWSMHSFSFEVATYTPDDVLVVSFAEPGDVWLESIQIMEETKAEFAARSESELRVGNLIPNGDFRLERFGWSTFAAVDRRKHYPLHTGKQYAVEPPVFRVEERAGQPVGVLELTEWNSSLVSDMLFAKMGHPFESVAKVRRTKGEGPVTFRLFSPSWSGAPAVNTSVGTDWKELRLKGSAPLDLHLRGEIMAAGGGELEIAEVSFQQRASTDGDPAPPGFGVVADRDMTAYVLGEAPRIRILSSGLKEREESVNWQLTDADANVVREGTWIVGKAEFTEDLKALPVGWYQLRWQAPWAANLAAGSFNLAIVPPVDRVPAKLSPWGIHVEGGDLGVEKMRLLGARWLRINNPLWTKWTAVQPFRDTWVFPDESVEKFTKAGMGIIGNLDRTPAWASRNPDNVLIGTDFHGALSTLPADWDAWEEYVRQMVRRYKDTITYWEIWNEPDIPFLTPPPGMTNAEAYMQLLEHSTPIIKTENPEAMVIASPAYVLKERSNPEGYQPDFTERLIELGGMKYIDIFVIHHYLRPGERLFDDPQKHAEKLNLIRQAMKDAGHKPVLWNTEWGIINFALSSRGVDLPSNNGLTGAQVAQEMVAWSAAQLAEGLEKLIWYDGQDNFYFRWHVTKNLFEHRQPTPLFAAYAILTKALDGLPFESSRMEDGDVRIVSFGTDGEWVDVAYGPARTKASLPVEEGRAVMDYLGRHLQLDANGRVSLDQGPIYIMSSERLKSSFGR